VTHGHLDHILGLAGLLSTYMRWEAIEELEIYAGRAALERIHDLLFGVVLRNTRPPIEVRLIELHPGPFFEGDDFTISATPVFHRGLDCYGFIFEEKPRRPFLADAAEALGIPPGPWRRDLVNGISVSLPDGRVIQPEQVLGEERPGTRLVHIGDVGQTENLVEPCRHADVLVIESTYLDMEADMAHDFAHMTAKQAAELAVRCGVKTLILTHISRRYRERDVLDEAQNIFPNTFVARDFDMFQIKQGECIKVDK
jgi:ribonuclease Z